MVIRSEIENKVKSSLKLTQAVHPVTTDVHSSLTKKDINKMNNLIFFSCKIVHRIAIIPSLSPDNFLRFQPPGR